MKFELWIIRCCIKFMWKTKQPVNILRMAYNKQVNFLIEEGDIDNPYHIKKN